MKIYIVFYDYENEEDIHDVCCEFYSNKDRAIKLATILNMAFRKLYKVKEVEVE